MALLLLYSLVSDHAHLGLDHTHLALDIAAFQCQQTGEDGVLHKGAVVHELSGSEGRHGLEEAGGRLLKVPHRNGVESLIRLESVPAIPVPTLLNQPAEIE